VQVKRIFSTERLYKLCRGIVVVVTLLNIFIIYSSIKAQSDWDKYRFSCNTNPSFSSEETLINDCQIFASKMETQSSDDTGKSITIAVFLPIIFFSGRLTYKYVFPKKQIKSASE
jgi:hypothetical protein